MLCLGVSTSSKFRHLVYVVGDVASVWNIMKSSLQLIIERQLVSRPSQGTRIQAHGPQDSSFEHEQRLTATLIKTLQNRKRNDLKDWCVLLTNWAQHLSRTLNFPASNLKACGFLLVSNGILWKRDIRAKGIRIRREIWRERNPSIPQCCPPAQAAFGWVTACCAIWGPHYRLWAALGCSDNYKSFSIICSPGFIISTAVQHWCCWSLILGLT